MLRLPGYGSPASRPSRTRGGLHARALAELSRAEPARVHDPRQPLEGRVNRQRPLEEISVNALDHVVAASAGELAAAIRAPRPSSGPAVEAHLRRSAGVTPRANAVLQPAVDA